MSIYAAEQASSCMAYLRSAMQRNKHLFAGPVPKMPKAVKDTPCRPPQPKALRDSIIARLAKGEKPSVLAAEAGIPRPTVFNWRHLAERGRLSKAAQAIWDEAKKEQGNKQ